MSLTQISCICAKYFRISSARGLAEVLHAALPQQSTTDAAENWDGTFTLLAVTLLREFFASRIRGFRQATQQSIVRSLHCPPGDVFASSLGDLWFFPLPVLSTWHYTFQA